MTDNISSKTRAERAAQYRKTYADLRRQKTALIRQGREHRHVTERMSEVSWLYRELTGGGIQ